MEGRSVHLRAIDGLRGLAVLSVVAWHAIMCWQMRDGGTLTWPSYGSRGVDLFFVISGVCLTLPALAAARANGTQAKLDYARFMMRRFVRIAPPYYLAIALFTILAFTPFGTPCIPVSPASATFWQNVVSDFAFLTPYSRLNPSFWTIPLEMRWYIMCPLLLALYARSRLLFALLGVGFAAGYATPWSTTDMGTLTAFMLGIVAADLYLRKPELCRYAVVPFVLLFVASAASDAGVRGVATYNPDQGALLWQLTCFCLVIAGLSILRPLFSFAPLAAAGTASYSIYLVHGPFMAKLSQIAPMPFAIVGAVLAGVVFYGLVERPLFDREFRGRLERLPALAPAMVLRRRPLRSSFGEHSI